MRDELDATPMKIHDDDAHSIARLQILAELRALAAEQAELRGRERPRAGEARAGGVEPTAPNAPKHAPAGQPLVS